MLATRNRSNSNSPRLQNDSKILNSSDKQIDTYISTIVHSKWNETRIRILKSLTTLHPFTPHYSIKREQIPIRFESNNRNELLRLDSKMGRGTRPALPLPPYSPRLGTITGGSLTPLAKAQYRLALSIHWIERRGGNSDIAAGQYTL